MVSETERNLGLWNTSNIYGGISATYVVATSLLGINLSSSYRQVAKQSVKAFRAFVLFCPLILYIFNIMLLFFRFRFRCLLQALYLTFSFFSFMFNISSYPKRNCKESGLCCAPPTCMVHYFYVSSLCLYFYVSSLCFFILLPSWLTLTMSAVEDTLQIFFF